MAIHSAMLFLRTRLQHVLNFGSFFLTRILSLGLFAGSASYYINHAGAQAYGILTLLLIVFSYMHIFDMGMGYAVNVRFTRRLARGHSNAEEVIRKAVPFYMVATLIIFAALFAGASLVSQLIFKTSDHAVDIRWLSVAVLFLMPSALCTAILQAYNRVYLINLSRVLLDVARAGAMLIAAALGKDLTFIVWFMVGGSFLKLLIDISLTTYVTKSNAWFRPLFSWPDLKLNTSFGLPIMATVCTGMIFNSIDKIFFARLFPQQLPFYSVAFDINTKAYFLIWAVNGSLYNVLLRRHAKGQSWKRLIKLSYFAVFIITLFYYFPLALFADNILMLWINSNFADQSAHYVRMMTIPAILYISMNILYVLVQSQGRAKLIFLSDISALTVLVLAMFTLAAPLGPDCIFVGFSLAFFVQAVMLIFFLTVKKT